MEGEFFGNPKETGSFNPYNAGNSFKDIDNAVADWQKEKAGNPDLILNTKPLNLLGQKDDSDAEVNNSVD